MNNLLQLGTEYYIVAVTNVQETMIRCVVLSNLALLLDCSVSDIFTSFSPGLPTFPVVRGLLQSTRPNSAACLWPQARTAGLRGGLVLMAGQAPLTLFSEHGGELHRTATPRLTGCHADHCH